MNAPVAQTASTAEAMGRFAAACSYDSLPPDTVAALKLRLLDTVGVVLYGYRQGTIRPLEAMLSRGDDVFGWGFGRRYNLRDGALINGFLAHATYNEDGSRFTGGHPASAVIPAALTLADMRGTAGTDLLTAIAVGYEVFLRLGRALYPSLVRRGFQSTSVLAPIASAAACASLLRLDAEAATHAIAIAANAAGGMKEALHEPASQPLQVGRGAEAGVTAALLAAAGVPGVRTILDRGLLKSFADETETSGVTRGLGEAFSVGETYIKIHGGCRGIHAPVDALCDLMTSKRLVADDADSVEIHIDTVTHAADVDTPLSAAQAQFSVRFAAAVSLLYGDASTIRFTEEMLADNTVQRLMTRITVVADTALDEGYPDTRPAIVTIRAGAKTFTQRLDHARGEPENPIRECDVLRKFDQFCPGARALRDMTLNAETIETMSQLTALIRAD